MDSKSRFLLIPAIALHAGHSPPEGLIPQLRAAGCFVPSRQHFIQALLIFLIYLFLLNQFL